jgi:hypothetical protein
MRKYILIAGILIAGICAKAQYIDYGWEILRMQMESNQRMNQIVNSAFDMLNKQIEEQAKNKRVAVSFLPGDYSDCYKAFVVMSSNFINDITICYYGKEDYSDLAVLESGDCAVFGQYIFLPSVLKPGHHLVILTKETETKTLFSGKIPKKGTSEYIAFQKEAYSNMARVNNQLSGIASGTVIDYGSSENRGCISGSRSRADIYADIHKIRRQRADAVRNKANDTSISGSMGWNSIIVNYDRMLSDLQQELRKTAY